MIPTWYNEYKDFIEKAIDKYLSNYFEKNISNTGLKRFKEALFYSMKGGKKIRSVFALEFYLIFSKKSLKDININDDIVKFCISLELVHTYSLIHDDLPCMDNDEYRRGELTIWKKYSEYEAVLLGDMLNSLAFENLSNIKNQTHAISLIKLLSRNIGFYGMLGGQVDDIYFENNFSKLDLNSLTSLQNKKTGALFISSIIGGITLSGNKEKIKDFEYFGNKIGLAFQIKDDLLDIEGTFEETGKSVGGENKGFVYFLGLEKTKEYLNNLETELNKLILPLKSKKLDFLVKYIINRKK